MAGSGQENDIIFAKNADFSGSATVSGNNGINADNQVWMGRSSSVGSLSQIDVMTLTAGPGISFSRTGEGVPGTPGVFEISATGPSTDLHDSRFIVSAGGAADGANYTTIASAIAAAVAAGGVQTIMIQPGTYTENLTLPANINLSAHVADAFTPNVTISGKITCSDAGSRSISGIRLKTNSDFCLVVSGSVATVVHLVECYIQASNNTAVSYTSSSSSSQINLTNCKGDFDTTGITLFVSTSVGFINIYNSVFLNTGLTQERSSVDNGTLFCKNSYFNIRFIFQNGGGCDFFNCEFDTSSVNLNCIRITSTTGYGSNFNFCKFSSGTADCLTALGNSTANIIDCSFKSSNTNCLVGGIFNFGNITFDGSSRGVNPVTGTKVISGGWVTPFTPTLNFGGTATATYTIRGGWASKIGSMVFINIKLQLTSKGAATGVATITGLPYQSATGYPSTGSSNQTILNMVCGAVTTTAGSTQFYAELPTASTALSLANCGSGSNASLTDTNFASNSVITITGMYLANI